VTGDEDPRRHVRMLGHGAANGRVGRIVGASTMKVTS